MKKSKIKQRIINLNLNPTKELITYVILILSSVILVATLSYYFKNYYILFALAVLLPLVSYAFYYRYKIYEEDKRRKLESEFLEVFSYIRIYLTNNENVYNAIRKSNEYTSKEMNYEINNFLSRIDEDKSIVPFLEFGEIFKNKIIEEVMISLYQMIDGGYTESYLNQFINIFDNFRARISQDNMRKRYKTLDSLNRISLVGSGYLMLVMLILIVRIIGELSNGL